MKNLRVALLAACVVALAGCGLRLETDGPAPPLPGPDEQVRAQTVTDAQALADAASALEPTADATLSPVLSDITTFSAAHIEALGGVYDSGLPTSAPTTTPTSAPTPAGLLDLLATATTTAATDTDQVRDPALARVLGSVAVARGELTARLAEALDVEVPSTAPASPAPPDASHPVVAPSLVLAHDQAGYAFEVIAAQAPAGSDLRGAAVTAAGYHRAQATAWARTGGFDGTSTDPRRAQYQLPDGLSDPATARALAVALEQAVAQAASAALADAAPGDRADLLADLGAATADATAWGATPDPLPGLPPTTTPTPSPTP